MDEWASDEEAKANGTSYETPEDYSEYCPKGYWSKQYKANKSHDCVRNSPYCPGEIREGEYYLRTAVLERSGKDRGTVVVTKACLYCCQ